VNGLGEKQFEHENGNMPTAGNHRNRVAGRVFENNVQHHLVVPRILMMLMIYPINNGAVDFHIAMVCDAGYLEHSITNIRPTI
jgi:hypothetical protein